MPDKELSQEVFTWVSQRIGVSSEDLSPNLRLLQDLGVTGDGAEQFLVAFGERFHVNLEDFPFEDFFTGEPSVKHLLWTLRIVKKPIRENKKLLTLGDLIGMADKGSWSRGIASEGTEGHTSFSRHTHLSFCSVECGFDLFPVPRPR